MVRAISISAILSTWAVAFPALATSSVNIGISAHVDPFCHIYPPQNAVITVTDGQAQIGEVREICNTPDGYSVSTAFTNLSAGQLDVGNMAYVIDSQGAAVRQSSGPAVQTLNWRLEHAQLASASMPVIMQVTISPR